MSSSALAIRRVKVVRYAGGLTRLVDDEVAVEREVRLLVGGSLEVTLTCTPFMLRELAVGYLYTSGLIDRVVDVVSVEVGPDEVRVEARLRRPPRRPKPLAGLGVEVTPEAVIRAVRGIGEAEVYRRTGGTHVAGLASPDGELLIVAEDVGRHNAVDKAVGWALLSEVDLRGGVLVVSGRLSTVMVEKAVMAGVPVVVSVSAPTSMGVELAERYCVTLLGFVRGDRFNVYTWPHRVKV